MSIRVSRKEKTLREIQKEMIADVDRFDDSYFRSVNKQLMEIYMRKSRLLNKKRKNRLNLRLKK